MHSHDNLFFLCIFMMSHQFRFKSCRRMIGTGMSTISNSSRSGSFQAYLHSTSRWSQIQWPRSPQTWSLSDASISNGTRHILRWRIHLPRMGAITSGTLRTCCLSSKLLQSSIRSSKVSAYLDSTIDSHALLLGAVASFKAVIQYEQNRRENELRVTAVFLAQTDTMRVVLE